MFIVVDDLDSSSYGKNSDRKRRFLERAAHDRAKLFGFPGFNLRLALFSMR